METKNMKNIKKASQLAVVSILLLGVVLTAGCTDGFKGKLLAYDASAKIKCYSADLLIFEGESTGKVSSKTNRDGYHFVDKKDGKLKEVSGNCVIEYDEY